MDQTQALGVSKELREAGYALMCVAFPLTDCRMETVEEDEVYELQFGESFGRYVSAYYSMTYAPYTLFRRIVYDL